jgi:hypothetical protein
LSDRALNMVSKISLSEIKNKLVENLENEINNNKNDF